MTSCEIPVRRVDSGGKRSHGYATAGFGLGEAKLTDWHFNKTTITIRISIQKTKMHNKRSSIGNSLTSNKSKCSHIEDTRDHQGIPLYILDPMWGMLEYWSNTFAHPRACRNYDFFEAPFGPFHSSHFGLLICLKNLFVGWHCWTWTHQLHSIP